MIIFILGYLENSHATEVFIWKINEKKKKFRELSEKAMAPYSSTLAWRIPWMEEPGRLQSMGSLRVGHD